MSIDLRQRPLVFSTRSYVYMRDRMAAHADVDVGELDVSFFPDGERYMRVRDDVAGRDVVLVGGTISDSDTLELFDLGCTFSKHGARRLTLVIPYFGYATMERAVHVGEVVTAKTRARLFSAIPFPTGSRVVLLDLHAEGIPHYFEGNVRPMHVYAKPIILEIARHIGGDDFVLASTDAGRAKWVESLANDLGVEASFVFKRRLDGAHTEVTAMNARVAGKCVILYDDMIRTGSSLVNAARAYVTAGAKSVAAIATHAVFPGDALDKILATNLFTTIACTDSHPRALALTSERFVVESVSRVLAAAAFATG